jgi:GT2 family glycosyltransferase
MSPDDELLVLPAGIAHDDEPEFDEIGYLAAHPEVAEAIANGHIPNAQFHYRLFGRHHQPQPPPESQVIHLEAPVEATVEAPAAAVQSIAANIDTLLISASGAMFLIGWADDRGDPLAALRLVPHRNGSAVEMSAPAIARFRRRDTEAALAVDGHHHFGFCAFVHQAQRHGDHGGRGGYDVAVGFASGIYARYPIEPRRVGDVALRELVLGYLNSMEFNGNKAVEAFNALDGAMGDALINYNRDITRSIASASAVERFDTGRACKASVIVCVYGRPEYQFIQNALFSASPGADEYEYIYVSNSPELLEIMCKTAQISRRIYGLNVSVVMLPDNAGFGAANNVAVDYAQSDRLLVVNPDVLPTGPDWAATHADMLTGLPADQTRLFGGRLFYADGSLMHAGMHFDVDWGISVSGLGIRRRPMLRVEHYGKGAPPDAAQFLGPHPVPAISGAFMSIERNWFERLGGFAEDYIFGHYEDADLCLRSIDRGTLPWLHDFRLWHLEGKGSVRLPHHEGASMVNRWLFTKLWHERVERDLLGSLSIPPRTG